MIGVVVLLGHLGVGNSKTEANTEEASKSMSIPGQLLPLAATESVIRVHYQSLSHILPDQLDAMRGSTRAQNVILLDVREPEEFNVSRLAGARRVDPAATIEEVLEIVGDVVDLDIVFYCSVGARSSKLAVKHHDRLMESGVRSVANLSGGIFRWHNEERMLVSGSGPTQLVHGYDGYWGRLIRRKDLIVKESMTGATGREAEKSMTSG